MHETFLHRQSGNSRVSRLKRMAIFIRDNFTCQHCGKNLKNVNCYSICLMKFFPTKSDSTCNLITACMSCAKQFRKYEPSQVFKPKEEYIRMLKHINKVLDLKLAKKVLIGESNEYPNPWSR